MQQKLLTSLRISEKSKLIIQLPRGFERVGDVAQEESFAPAAKVALSRIHVGFKMLSLTRFSNGLQWSRGICK